MERMLNKAVCRIRSPIHYLNLASLWIMRLVVTWNLASVQISMGYVFIMIRLLHNLRAMLMLMPMLLVNILYLTKGNTNHKVNPDVI